LTRADEVFNQLPYLYHTFLADKQHQEITCLADAQAMQHCFIFVINGI